MWEFKVKKYLECNIYVDFLLNMFIKNIIKMYFFLKRKEKLR